MDLVNIKINGMSYAVPQGSTILEAARYAGIHIPTLCFLKDINEIGALAVKMLNDKSKIGWTTHAHSAHAVPIFAVGVGAERFSGWHDNSDIAKLILRATGTR